MDFFEKGLTNLNEEVNIKLDMYKNKIKTLPSIEKQSFINDCISKIIFTALKSQD